MANPLSSTSPNSHSRRSKRLWLCLSAIPFLSLLGYSINIAFVFKADNPYYSLDTISVHGFASGRNGNGFTVNVTGSALNPNNNIDFYLLEGNSLTVSTDFDVGLCGGTFGASVLAAKETAPFQIVLVGPGFPQEVNEMLMKEMEVETKMIPLKFAWKLRVKIQGVAFKTWIVTQRVRCLVVVDGLSDRVAILTHTCG